MIAGEFVDAVGKSGAGSPEQIGVIAPKVGVTGVFTVTSRVVVLAHCPGSGVKV